MHVGYLILDGQVTEPGTEGDPPSKLSANDSAHAAAFLAAQPSSACTFELDIRPRMETW